jgi:hypothetical protein
MNTPMPSSVSLQKADLASAFCVCTDHHAHTH